MPDDHDEIGNLPEFPDHDEMAAMVAGLDQAAKGLPMIAPVLAAMYRGLLSEGIPERPAAMLAAFYITSLIDNEADDGEG